MKDDTFTLLLDLIHMDDHSRIESLVKTDPSLLSRTDLLGRQPLHCACEARSANAARILISLGADINAPGYDGRRPLHYAVKHRLPTVVRALLCSGAEPNALDSHGVSPIRLATDLYDPEQAACFTELLSYCAPLELGMVTYLGMFQIAILMLPTLRTTLSDEDIEQLIEYALRAYSGTNLHKVQPVPICITRQREFVAELLRFGATPTRVDGYSILVKAVRTGDIELVKLITSAGLIPLLSPAVLSDLMQIADNMGNMEMYIYLSERVTY